MGNTLKLDISGLEEMLRKLDAMGGDVNSAVSEALETAGNQIRQDTQAALAPGNLPAGGRFSSGDTAAAVVTDTRARWEGTLAWIPVGFDFAKPGAGGFLITGTPRMQPDHALHAMYKQKRYMTKIQNDMQEVVWKYLEQIYSGA